MGVYWFAALGSMLSRPLLRRGSPKVQNNWLSQLRESADVESYDSSDGYYKPRHPIIIATSRGGFTLMTTDRFQLLAKGILKIFREGAETKIPFSIIDNVVCECFPVDATKL